MSQYSWLSVFVRQFKSCCVVGAAPRAGCDSQAGLIVQSVGSNHALAPLMDYSAHRRASELASERGGGQSVGSNTSYLKGEASSGDRALPPLAAATREPRVLSLDRSLLIKACGGWCHSRSSPRRVDPRTKHDLLRSLARRWAE